MVSSKDYVAWLHEVDRDDVHLVGGKVANLGEMIQAKFPVPDGFVITATAYFHFIHKNKLDLKINHLLGTINFSHESSLLQVSSHIKSIVTHAEIPQEITSAIFSFYEKLGKKALVAIRSSATSEDSKTASFAGQQETFLNVTGEAVLIEKIREAWASLFEARALYYRHNQRMNHSKAGISLAVQRMVQSESSGVMFTIDPVYSDKSKIIIEAIWGLGEYIVQGKETPDHYEVDKKNFNLITKHISQQHVMLVKSGITNKEKKIESVCQKAQKISDKDVVKLAKLGAALEAHYYFPQDIEWAKENEKLYIVQTRPITTLSELSSHHHAKSQNPGFVLKKPGTPLLIGDPASPGIGIGKVRIITSPSQIDKVKNGDVLVAPYTSPDYVPAMKRAAAIITERGGRTSHAAIVSREFGIPAVVGAARALKVLGNDELVTVNGKTGEVFKGSVLIQDTLSKHSLYHGKTKTQVLVNLAEPELAATVAEKNVDGVGLLRAEFMVAHIGVHPKKLIRDKKQSEFVNKLADGLETFCKAFYPRSVLYRATDFKSNEYRNLKGGNLFETIESNPMLGYRGAFRYVADPEVFKLEIEAIKKVREKKGFNNLNLMIPFVRTPKELEDVKKLINSYGLRRSHTFKLYMMVEIPSNVILLEEFIEKGIDGLSIGSNDLTMLVLGIDRDNQEVAREFDERDPAVLWCLERVIKTAKKHGVPVSLCGQAASNYPDLVQKLVWWGIHGVSVDPGAIDITREVIHNAEQKLHPGLR